MRREGYGFTMTRREIEAFERHASDDPTRKNLSAVAFDFNRRRVAATDGHGLLVCQCEANRDAIDGFGIRLVPLPDVIAIRKACGTGRDVRIVAVATDDGRVSFYQASEPAEASRIAATRDGSAMLRSVAPVGEKFPPIDQVIPDRTAGITGGAYLALTVSPTLFARVDTVRAAIVSQVPNATEPGFRFDLSGAPLDPLRFEAEGFDGSTYTAVAMPMRGDPSAEYEACKQATGNAYPAPAGIAITRAEESAALISELRADLAATQECLQEERDALAAERTEHQARIDAMTSEHGAALEAAESVSEERESEIRTELKDEIRDEIRDEMRTELLADLREVFELAAQADQARFEYLARCMNVGREEPIELLPMFGRAVA